MLHSHYHISLGALGSDNQPVYDEETMKQLLEDNSNKLQDEYTLIIDNLEEEIITLRHTLQADEDALKKVAEQNVILNKNFELLLKEKRSDIIKNYEQELLALKQNDFRRNASSCFFSHRRSSQEIVLLRIFQLQSIRTPVVSKLSTKLSRNAIFDLINA